MYKPKSPLSSRKLNISPSNKSTLSKGQDIKDKSGSKIKSLYSPSHKSNQNHHHNKKTNIKQIQIQTDISVTPMNKMILGLEYETPKFCAQPKNNKIQPLNNNFFSFGEHSLQSNLTQKKNTKKKKTQKSKIQDKQNITKIKKHLQGYFR